MAHMDVDEFFVLVDQNITVLEYAKTFLGPESRLDCIAFRPHVLDHCNGYVVESESVSPVESKQCYTKSHASDVKLIMNMETMQHFQVHYALATKAWKSPRQYQIPWGSKISGPGFLAHYRGEITPGRKSNKWVERVPFFDKFLAERKIKKGIAPGLLADSGA